MEAEPFYKYLLYKPGITRDIFNQVIEVLRGRGYSFNCGRNDYDSFKLHGGLCWWKGGYMTVARSSKKAGECYLEVEDLLGFSITSNTLPKSWCVLNDLSDLFKETVIAYLKENYESNYSGDSISFYGVDNLESAHCYPTRSSYDKNTVLLTLSEFIARTSSKGVHLPDIRSNSVIISVPKI